MAKRIVADDAKFSAFSAGKDKIVLPVAPDKKHGDALFASLHKKKYSGKDVEDEALDDQLPVIADAEGVAPDSAFSATEQSMLLAQADAAIAPASDSIAAGQTTASNSGSNSGWWWLGAGVVATGAGIGVGVSGGGGGGNSGGGTTTIAGTVTDGPVQGARLYLDVNGNGTYDAGTDTAVLDADGNQVVTDASGNFSFTVTGSGAGIKLVTNGGIDTVTGEAVTLDFSAPAGYSQINPITSAIAAYMEANGVTATEAETAVESALGLPDLDYSTVNLADPPAGLAAADILDAQQAAAILATTAIIIQQSGADTDAFDYVSNYVAENMGSGGSTTDLAAAVQEEPSVGPAAAGQLADTVAAINAATSLGAIGEALNETLFADVTTSGTVSVGQTVSGELGLGNATGLEVAYQWQSSVDGSTWTDIAGATETSYQLTSADSGDHIRLRAVYTNTAGVAQTVYSTDMGVVPIPNVPPVLGDYTVTLAENSANGTAVQTVIGSDANGNALSYSITAGNTLGAFAINSVTGVITVADAGILDLEANPSFSLTVQASDGSLTDTGSVTVNLANVNDAPAIISNGGGATASVNTVENQTAVTTVTSTDVDAGDGKTFSLTGGVDQALFVIDGTTGALTFQSSPNFETPGDVGSNNVYDVQVTVTDTAGLTDVQDLAVTVTNANEAPIITSNAGGTTAALNAAENQTAVTTVTSTDADAGDGKTFSLTGGADQALFSIDVTSGALTFQSAPNFETPGDTGSNNVYDVQVTVTDTAGLTDVQDLAVTVTNANEAPVITSNAGGATASLSAAENQTAITIVTSTDVDAGDGKTFSISGGADAALFAINASTGVLTFVSAPNYETPADFGGNNIYEVQVTGTDTAGLTDTQALAITVTNINEHVVVDATGAWIDVNGNGILNAEDSIAADFSANVDLAGGAVTVHFNSAPTIPLDLTGFGADDKIEIDVVQFNAAYMQTSPANGFTTLVSNVTPSGALYYVSMTMDNSMYFTPFLQTRPTHLLSYPSAATLPAANKGALAFYDIGYKYLAYWTDASNPLRDIHNILPGIQTNSNAFTGGTDTALAVLNQGAGHGILIDFLWGNPFPATAVVVEATGAWLDANADGVHDVNETTPWLGGIDNLAGHQVTIHFNNDPHQSLDLHGFGSDDLIEIDAQAFINNGHNALNILTRPNILKTDEFSVPGTLPLTSNILSNSGLGFANWYATSNGALTSARVGLFNSSSSLYFTSNNGSRTSLPTSYQFATGISTNLPLQQMVNFVNFPEPPTTVHVVVERDGAVIDYDGDGVRDNGENRLAVFGADGNADLAGSVILHFNDLPLSALDLTGFGTNDKIEFDVGSLQGNNVNVLNPTAAAAGLNSFAFEGLGLLGYYFSRTTGTSPSITTHVTWIRVNHSTVLRTDFNGNPHGDFGITFNHINTSINSRTHGLIAYWTDPLNALNGIPNLLPDYVGTPTNNNSEVLANLNNNHYPGLVEFVWPVNVVVDDQAGTVATFIDANANGVRDFGEDTLALIGQTQADVDVFNAAAGTAYLSQAVDLASEQVTIHYNDLPAGAWMPNLSGFDGNDRIEIDIAAVRNNITVADTMSLSSQPIQSISSSQTQVYARVSGVSIGNTAVYVSGGNLKFGHRTTTTTIIGSSPGFNAYYTVSGAQEGIIAGNATALANHFQQVAFVTAVM